MNCSFVSDGIKRARAACEPAVRAEVEKEYAARLQSASWFQRCLLQLKMNREINRRLERFAPSDGHYLSIGS